MIVVFDIVINVVVVGVHLEADPEHQHQQGRQVVQEAQGRGLHLP